MNWRIVALAACGVFAFLVASGFVLLFKSNDRVASLGGPFTMTSDTGETVTEALFEGKPTALFFGFIRCPDVCPVTLGELAVAARDLGEKADDLNVVFVSVDPERDLPAVLHSYVDAFDERFIGLTGTLEQMSAMAKSWGVYYRKIPLEGGGYTMDHTAKVFLLDRDGHYTGSIHYNEDQATVLKKLRRLIERT